MIDEDIELYSLFRKGDRKAFDTLFLKYYSILCAFGKYYIPIEDAEEVVLDIMTWLWENREFQIIETSLRSYLFMAVRNRCLDLISLKSASNLNGNLNCSKELEHYAS